MNKMIYKPAMLCALLLAGSCSDSSGDDSPIVVPPSGDVKEQVVTVFSHPGILFNYADMARIREQAYSRVEPWQSGFNKLKGKANANYPVSGPFEEVERTEGVNSQAANALSADSQMAYHCAVMWFISGEQAYADKSIEILNAWSGTLRSLVGGDDMLMAAWYGFNLVNAAEILRYTDCGWAEKDVKRAETMFLDVFYDLIRDWKRGRAGNWDTAITKMHMGIGVFTDDRDIFDRAVAFYRSSDEGSNGTLPNNIYPTGQNFESARDQNHTQMGLGGLAESCEVAWKQGIDLWSSHDDLLLKGYEYTAKYNLGYDDLPEFISNVYGSVISTSDRGVFAPIYEIVYNHYVNRRGTDPADLPYTIAVVNSVRDNGGEDNTSINLGLGTLLFNEASWAQ